MRRHLAATLADAMPATTTSHGLRPTSVRRADVDGVLGSTEREGFTTARVIDRRAARDSGREPLGHQVELDLAGEVLLFSWGHPWELGTAAYWAEQTRRRPRVPTFALGGSLASEVAACLLGGHGIPAAVGLAAFYDLRDAGLLDGTPTAGALEARLRRPLSIPGRPRPVRYRFPAQRASRIAAALDTLSRSDPPRDPLALREWLRRLPGVGPKTASWVVRNRYACPEVAIVDVHVQRAGLAAGFFAPGWRLPRDYRSFELAFCQVARLARVSTAAFDACIWDQLQSLGRAAPLLLGR